MNNTKRNKYARRSKKEHWVFFFSLFSYQSFNGLSCFLRRLTSLKLCTSTPSASLNHPPAAGAPGFPPPLTKPVNSGAVHHSWELPSWPSQRGTGRRETQNGLRRGGREKGEKGITRPVEAIKEKHATNGGPAPASAQLRLQTKFGS